MENYKICGMSREELWSLLIWFVMIKGENNVGK